MGSIHTGVTGDANSLARLTSPRDDEDDTSSLDPQQQAQEDSFYSALSDSPSPRPSPPGIAESNTASPVATPPENRPSSPCPMTPGSNIGPDGDTGNQGTDRSSLSVDDAPLGWVPPPNTPHRGSPKKMLQKIEESMEEEEEEGTESEESHQQQNTTESEQKGGEDTDVTKPHAEEVDKSNDKQLILDNNSNEAHLKTPKEEPLPAKSAQLEVATQNQDDTKQTIALAPTQNLDDSSEMDLHQRQDSGNTYPPKDQAFKDQDLMMEKKMGEEEGEKATQDRPRSSGGQFIQTPMQQAAGPEMGMKKKENKMGEEEEEKKEEKARPETPDRPRSSGAKTPMQLAAGPDMVMKNKLYRPTLQRTISSLSSMLLLYINGFIYAIFTMPNHSRILNAQ